MARHQSGLYVCIANVTSATGDRDGASMPLGDVMLHATNCSDVAGVTIWSTRFSGVILRE